MPTALTSEQLCSRAQGGDTHAGDRLIENNLPFVQQTANKFAADPYRQEQFASCGITIDDLVQAGSIGLWRAIDSYDPACGGKFLTYAAPAVRRAMLDLIEQYSRDTIWRLRTDHDQPQQVVCLGKSLKDDDGEETVESLITLSGTKLPEQICIERETAAELYEAMDALSEREGMYIRYRFGFEDDTHSLAETAGHFHLSESRAKGLEQNTLKLLRHELLVAIPGRAIARAEDRLTKLLVTEGELHSVELRLKFQKKQGKKITAAVYEYLADCDGRWGELCYNFKEDTAEIILLADWDTLVSHGFAMRAVEHLKIHHTDKLPDKIVLTFIGPEQRGLHNDDKFETGN